MDKALEQHVRQRAGFRCEYCHLPEILSDLGHVIDHVRAQQHRGATVPENLASACGRCNLSKGPNLTGIDPETDQITTLFNPRADVWAEHFRWNGAVLAGLTAIGRTTVEVLAINHPRRIALRRTLISLGRLPLD